jgi:hypothetical protein
MIETFLKQYLDMKKEDKIATISELMLYFLKEEEANGVEMSSVFMETNRITITAKVEPIESSEDEE